MASKISAVNSQPNGHLSFCSFNCEKHNVAKE